MKSYRWIVPTFFAALLAPALAQLPQPSAPLPDRTGAERVREAFDRIQRDHREGLTEARDYRLSESDLNAFLLEELDGQPNPAVEKLAVKLRGGNVFLTSIRVNLDELDVGGGSMASGLMAALMNGRHDMEVEGLLESSGGVGAYRVRSARLNGIPIPATVLQSILRSAGARANPPFDPTAPFQFEYGIQRVEIGEGAVVIHAGGG